MYSHIFQNIYSEFESQHMSRIVCVCVCVRVPTVLLWEVNLRKQFTQTKMSK